MEAMNPESRRRYERYRAFTRALARKGGWRFLLTDLGHMFLSPGPVITAERLKERWLEHAARARRRREIPETNLYISVPYCRFRCHYCYIYKESPKNASQLESYKRRLCGEIRYFSSLSRRLEFAHVYMGGGSPTLFSQRQLADICRELFGALRFQKGGERTVEGHPADMTPGKLKVLREGGFNVVSLGVQSLDSGILRRVGRGVQTREMVSRVVGWAREAGFESVKLDLMVGLENDDGEAAFESFKALGAMGPEEITIYLCEPTPYYLRRRWNGDLDGFQKNLESQRSWLVRAIEWGQANGFPGGKLGPAGGLAFGSRKRKGGYSSDILKPLQWLFSLGPNGVSYVYDDMNRRLQYEGLPLEENPQDNRFRTWELSALDGMRLFVLECFGRGGTLSASEFQRLFRRPLESVFGEGLAHLQALGLAERGEGGIRLKRELGWDERFAAGMFLFDHAWLVESLNRVLAVAPLEVQVDARRHELRVRYDASPRGSFALEAPQASPPLDRKIMEACRRNFQGLIEEAEGLDVFEFRRLYADRLGVLLEKLGAKMGGHEVGCGR